jgi:hypothetical protein
MHAHAKVPYQITLISIYNPLHSSTSNLTRGTVSNTYKGYPHAPIDKLKLPIGISY